MKTINTVPHSKNTEYAVLSLMLKHSDNITLCSDLTKEDFYDENACAVYEAIKSLSSYSYKRVDASTVTDYVQKIGAKHILLADIQELASMPVHSDKLNELKRELKERKGERRLLKSSAEINQVVFDPLLTFDEKVVKSTSFFSDIGNSLEDNTVTYADAHTSVIDFVIQKKNNKNQNLRFGFQRLDDILGGISADLIIIGGMTGMGKTAFITNVAQTLSDDEHHGLFFSAEMNAEEVLFREIQRGTGIQVTKMRLGEVSDYEVQMIKDFKPAKNIHINDCSSLDVDRLCSIAKIHYHKYPLKYILVDYLQLLTTTKHRNDPIEQVKYIANQLKGLSKDLKIPVIALAQFNKDAGKALDRKPEIGNLRDSSQIAMNAGVILFIHRADYFDKEIAMDRKHPQNGLVELIVAKNRYGIANVSAYARWTPNRASFTDVDEKFVIPEFPKKSESSGFRKQTKD